MEYTTVHRGRVQGSKLIGMVLLSSSVVTNMASKSSKNRRAAVRGAAFFFGSAAPPSAANSSFFLAFLRFRSRAFDACLWVVFFDAEGGKGPQTIGLELCARLMMAYIFFVLKLWVHGFGGWRAGYLYFEGKVCLLRGGCT